MFPENISEQAVKLTKALAMVVANLRRWDEVAPALDNLARNHVGYGVEAEHYAVVGTVLIRVLEEALGDAFTAEARDAWATAYGAIADRMIVAAYRDAA